MSPERQTIVALVIVALAAAWLGWRWLAKRKNPGCGGECGCDAQRINAKIKRR
ncbi:MAG: FeoB-associated Cys-rich membrane protein [Verrucomicrobia bacterium]|nr:FeoB-associated Cys-rich membrane protein [Verrucomicrobiota bacterium]